MENERFYTLSGLTAHELRDEISQIWDNLKTDPKTRQQVEAAGIDLATLRELTAHEAFDVRTGAMGLDPATAAVIISFSPVAAKVLADLWDCCVLPWIERKKGSGALKKRKK